MGSNAAIERCDGDNGRAPSRLEDLVPRWMERLPTRLPPLELVEGERGNSWRLSALVPIGLLNWDRFVYMPNQDYPEHDTGGVYQRLGRWPYYHE
ncbi:MAG: hypothetical protein ABL997_21175 [Planctomycetota bacterium]